MTTTGYNNNNYLTNESRTSFSINQQPSMQNSINAYNEQMNLQEVNYYNGEAPSAVVQQQQCSPTYPWWREEPLQRSAEENYEYETVGYIRNEDINLPTPEGYSPYVKIQTKKNSPYQNTMMIPQYPYQNTTMMMPQQPYQNTTMTPQGPYQNTTMTPQGPYQHTMTPQQPYQNTTMTPQQLYQNTTMTPQGPYQHTMTPQDPYQNTTMAPQQPSQNTTMAPQQPYQNTPQGPYQHTMTPQDPYQNTTMLPQDSYQNTAMSPQDVLICPETAEQQQQQQQQYEIPQGLPIMNNTIPVGHQSRIPATVASSNIMYTTFSPIADNNNNNENSTQILTNQAIAVVNPTNEINNTSNLGTMTLLDPDEEDYEIADYNSSLLYLNRHLKNTSDYSRLPFLKNRDGVVLFLPKGSLLHSIQKQESVVSEIHSSGTRQHNNNNNNNYHKSTSGTRSTATSNRNRRRSKHKRPTGILGCCMRRNNSIHDNAHDI